jgi:hypothetical protein
MNEYDDETSSYHDDEDELENEIYGNTISVHRPDSRHPIIDSNNKKPFVSQSSYRIPFFSTNLWNDLYSKPAILVGKSKLNFQRKTTSYGFVFLIPRCSWWNHCWYAFSYSSYYVYNLSNA